MRTNWISMLLVASLTMNAAVVAVAGYAFFHNRSRAYPGSSPSDDRDHHFYEVLKLSPAQLKAMTPMADSFHEDLSRLYADMENKKTAMISMLSGEKKVTRDRIEGLRREMAVIQDMIQKTVIRHILDVKSILDAGQQERFFGLLRKSMTEEHHMFISPGEN